MPQSKPLKSNQTFVDMAEERHGPCIAPVFGKIHKSAVTSYLMHMQAGNETNLKGEELRDGKSLSSGVSYLLGLLPQSSVKPGGLK